MAARTIVATVALAALVAGCAAAAPVAGSAADAGRVTVHVDATAPIGEVSPLIRGMSGDVDAAYITDVGVTLNSWGGNPATRYNFALGNAWNAGRDWAYRNGNYGASGDVARAFLRTTHEAGAAARLAVPTLGWVAKDDRNATCSFPTADGPCGDGGGASCDDPGPVTDPHAANVRVTPDEVAAWVSGLVADGLGPRFVAMDNEPELWGVTHYDVHPSCTTYEEVLDTYLATATAVRRAAPDVELMGPVTCCWHSWWEAGPGPADGSDEPFLPWFLERVRAHDDRTGVRTLDVVDVHYYPQSDVYDDRADAATAARRLRSTRALWDPGYVDESWIDAPVAAIPQLQAEIAASYPGTPLAVSEWNFGADTSTNGALAIADALGIYGREGVHAAAYWRSPPRHSPGYFAFKLHGNYDDAGSSFTGTAVPASTPDPDVLGSFATVEPDVTRVLLLNKQPATPLTVRVQLGGVEAAGAGTQFRYAPPAPTTIQRAPVVTTADTVDVALPPSSITLLELPTHATVRSPSEGAA